MNSLDQQRFLQVWQQLGGRDDPEALFNALARAYAEPHRAYHTTIHLQDCLDQLDTVKASLDEVAQVEIALWFHDAIYDTQAKDNEVKSAAWASTALTSSHISLTVAQNVANLIMMTQHQALPQANDARFTIDIDLSILGRAPVVFAEYDRQIRLEYHWVPEDEYRRRRGQVLTGFVARPTIYQTAFFQTRYEQQARQNLAQAIKRLADRC